jgi:hypothetical protein
VGTAFFYLCDCRVKAWGCNIGALTVERAAQHVLGVFRLLTPLPSLLFSCRQNGAGAGDRIGGTPAFPWPKPDKPMMFWAQLGPEEISASGACAAGCV